MNDFGRTLCRLPAHVTAAVRLAEAATVGLRSADLLRAAGDLWNLANVLSFVALDLAFMIDFEQANRIGAEAYELADRLGHFPARWLANRSEWIEIQTGQLER